MTQTATSWAGLAGPPLIQECLAKLECNVIAESLGLPCSGWPIVPALQAVWRQSAGEAVSPTFIQTNQPAQNPGLFMSR